MSEKRGDKNVRFSLKKMNATLKKVDKIFSKKMNSNLSLKGEKKEKKVGNTKSTLKKYSGQMKMMIKELKINNLSELTGDRVMEYVEKEIDNYHNGDLAAAGRINVRLSALASLEQGARETSVLGTGAKESLDFGDIGEMRKIVLENNVYRSKSGSSWKVPTNRELRTIKDRLDRKYEETKDPLDRIAKDYVRYSQITGSRPSNGLSVRNEDIRINDDGTATVIHYRDKGGLTRRVDIFDKESVKFLKELKTKSDHGKIFQGYKEDKTLMSNVTLQKEIRERVSEVTKDMVSEKEISVKNNDDSFKIKQRVTLHTIRKNFTMNRVTELYDYFMRNPKETEKRMDEVLMRFAKNDMKVLKKYNDLLDKKTRANKRYREKQNEINNENRTDYKIVDKLSVEQTTLYLVSCELGHFRTDVIRDSYVDHQAWDKIKAKYRK